MTRRVLLLVLCLLLGACGNDDDAGSVGVPSPEATFPIATALLDNGDESTLVTVEVAETAEQQGRGLSGRSSLEDDWGMVFVYFEEQETGLSLEGTTIPLSVAYFDARGTIVGIADFDPCDDAPCESGDPGAAYLGALAVNQGSFEQWDIAEGDTIHLTR